MGSGSWERTLTSGSMAWRPARAVQPQRLALRSKSVAIPLVTKWREWPFSLVARCQRGSTECRRAGAAQNGVSAKWTGSKKIWLIVQDQSALPLSAVMDEVVAFKLEHHSSDPSFLKYCEGINEKILKAGHIVRERPTRQRLEGRDTFEGNSLRLELFACVSV
jgi:hypothetical protein